MEVAKDTEERHIVEQRVAVDGETLAESAWMSTMGVLVILTFLAVAVKDHSNNSNYYKSQSN